MLGPGAGDPCMSRPRDVRSGHLFLSPAMSPSRARSRHVFLDGNIMGMKSTFLLEFERKMGRREEGLLPGFIGQKGILCPAVPELPSRGPTKNLADRQTG